MNKSIIENNYVVLDVETNGTSSLNNDLLSISIYKPDDKKAYNRFLPLELENKVNTTPINGIKTEDLINLKPLNQEEVNYVIKEFELDQRIILTYGSLDERFIKNYFKRKNLLGYKKMKFFNFKRNIISSRFAEGTITKDNLCNLYGIKNINKIHSSINDCKLEWQLFKKIYNKKLFVNNNDVYEFNNNYLMPAKKIDTHTNFKFHIKNLPKLNLSEEEIFSQIIKTSCKYHNYNITIGNAIENLINTMLDVKKIDSKDFLIKNKSKLKYIGSFFSNLKQEPEVNFCDNGLIEALNEKDKLIIDDINKFLIDLKNKIQDLIKFIKYKLFYKEEVFSQELVIDKNNKIFALCDLSSKTKILEIKSKKIKQIKYIAYQLYYESNGREIYLLQLENLNDYEDENDNKELIFSQEDLNKIKNNEMNIFNKLNESSEETFRVSISKININYIYSK